MRAVPCCQLMYKAGHRVVFRCTIMQKWVIGHSRVKTVSYTLESNVAASLCLGFRFILEDYCWFSPWMPSVLWHCWFGVRKSIRPIKIVWWGVGMVVCLERGADCLHMVQLMSLPSKKPRHLLPRINPDWFYLSHTGLPRLSWKKAIKHSLTTREFRKAVNI